MSTDAPPGEITPTIAIVGAGAAGLAAAIFAGEAARDRPPESRPRLVLLDGAKRLGAKILVAGGGRCNVTHHAVRPDDYHGNRHIIRNVLRRFPVERTVDWFAALGVELKREPTGKLFPVTDDAHTVLDALLARCRDLAVEIRPDHRVHRCDHRSEAPRFAVHHTHGTLEADRLILATGGRSLPKTGSDGQAYAFARQLGHSVTDTHAALAPLVLDSGFFHAALSGVSHEATLRTFVEGKKADERTGSLLWTHFGVSGPVAMDASRFWTVAHDAGRPVAMKLAVLPGPSFDAVDRRIVELTGQHPRSRLADLFADHLPGRLMPTLLAHLGLNPDRKLAELPKTDRRRLAHGLTDLALPVVKHRGWNYAEVTAGGVPLEEIDHRTMASRRCDGLYLVGEILDCDGRIGGFNFQWAWATGRIAGRAAVDSR